MHLCIVTVKLYVHTTHAHTNWIQAHTNPLVEWMDELYAPKSNEKNNGKQKNVLCVCLRLFFYIVVFHTWAGKYAIAFCSYFSFVIFAIMMVADHQANVQLYTRDTCVLHTVCFYECFITYADIERIQSAGAGTKKKRRNNNCTIRTVAHGLLLVVLKKLHLNIYN